MRFHMQEHHRRLILCSPTGSGKTVMFSAMARRSIDKGKKVMILTDRQELMNQTHFALQQFELNPAKIIAGDTKYTEAPCYVAMIETMKRRLTTETWKELLKSIDLVIFDEAHKTAFDKIFPYIRKDAYVIGATATPIRIGKQTSLSKHYTQLVESVKIQNLIDDGYLAKPNYYTVPVDLAGVGMYKGEYDTGAMGKMYSERKVYGGVISNYMQICPGKKALAFSSNIDSSVELCSKMREAGLSAKHVDSEMTHEERRSILEWYKTTPNAILCNVGILTTGFDDPATEVVILYRATTSLALYLQMVGRGSRVTPTKTEFTILDFGNNMETHGPWHEDRIWSLDKRPAKGGVAPHKKCPKCEYLCHNSFKECPSCGHKFEAPPQEIMPAVNLKKVQYEIFNKKSEYRLEDLAAMHKADPQGIGRGFVLHNVCKCRCEAEKWLRLISKSGKWKAEAYVKAKLKSETDPTKPKYQCLHTTCQNCQNSKFNRSASSTTGTTTHTSAADYSR
jgi:superfamily II DNA or RNA helicase